MEYVQHMSILPKDTSGVAFEGRSFCFSGTQDTGQNKGTGARCRGERSRQDMVERLPDIVITAFHGK